jgi:hypothetical protein
MAAVMTDCVSRTERSSGVSIGSVTTTSEQMRVISIGYEHDQDPKKDAHLETVCSRGGP